MGLTVDEIVLVFKRAPIIDKRTGPGSIICLIHINIAYNGEWGDVL